MPRFSHERLKLGHYPCAVKIAVQQKLMLHSDIRTTMILYVDGVIEEMAQAHSIRVAGTSLQVDSEEGSDLMPDGRALGTHRPEGTDIRQDEEYRSG